MSISFEIKSHHRFMITPNNEALLKTTKDDRRNFIIRCSDEKKATWNILKHYITIWKMKMLSERFMIIL